MENQNTNNNNKIVISLLIIIIVLLSILCILITTGTISFNSNNKQSNQTNKNTNNVENNETNQKNNTEENGNNSNNDKTIGDNVNIDLSINNIIVSKDAPNTKIKVNGTINLSYDNNKYSGVKLSGYCLGINGEKYFIVGPGDGRALFHNDDNKNLSLVETTKNIEYPDGTVKEWSWEAKNWENIKIKYCRIDKMTAYFNGSTQTLEKSLNFEKSFN